MEIRLIKDSERALCNDFHNKLRGTNRTIQQWEWEFAVNIEKDEPIPFAVIVDEGRIIGTQALIPVQMIDTDGIYWTAKSEETLLDPDYRGKKLLEKMYDLMFDYVRRRGFINIWGFTSAIKSFERTGFSIPSKTEQLVFPFSSDIVRALMERDNAKEKENAIAGLKIGALKAGCRIACMASSLKFMLSVKSQIDGLDIRTWEAPDEKAGALCQRFVKKWGGTTIYRDAQYLKWRIFENPYVKSVVRAAYSGDELQGWVAFTLGDNGMGNLVDLISASNDPDISDKKLVRTLIREAVIGTRNMGACGIRGWRVNNHPFDNLIQAASRKAGFYRIRRGDYVVLFNCENAKTRSSCNNFDNWFVSRIYTEGTQG